MGQQHNAATLTEYIVSSRDHEDVIKASGYEIDGAWVHFYGDGVRMVASFHSMSVFSVKESTVEAAD